MKTGATVEWNVEQQAINAIAAQADRPSILLDESEADMMPYRSRTVAMVHRYARISVEVGRLPSLLGREFFRSSGSAETRRNFEDRMIFVADMENALDKLDEVERKLIAMHVIEDYDTLEMAKLLDCSPRNVRRRVGRAVDQVSRLLLGYGMLEELYFGAGYNVSRGQK